MSYDFFLEVDTGGPRPYIIDPALNYTGNVAPMWRRALRAAGPAVGSIRDLDGQRAGACVSLLKGAIQDMREHAAEYGAMNPSNSWGNATGALEVLTRLEELCRDNPNATVRISR